MNEILKRIAFKHGIKIDAFGSPVVDHERMLQGFAAELILGVAELSKENSKKPKKEQEDIVSLVKTKYGI